MTNQITKFMPILALFFTWLYIFNDGISTAISIWAGSEIFNHCFLVIPVALFLIYQKRYQLYQQPFKANYWLLLPLIGTLVLYTFGNVGDIRLFMHLATFVSLPLIIWLLIGNSAAKVISFPLYFMLFSIPVGEQLIPFLQELTTDLAVPLIEMSGVPIYRNGLYLDIPQGRFLVAEACSGISFLIASFVFGNIYAYISFRTLPKQLLFVSISLIVPIVANALRVFGIVFTAHLTDMEYAAGADHLIYGGVFYTIILFLLILIGERFRDKNISLSGSEQRIMATTDKKRNHHLIIAIVISLFVLQATWLASINNKLSIKTMPQIKIEQLATNLVQRKLTNWQPHFPLAAEVKQGTININESDSIDFFVAAYAGGDGELISSLNRLYDEKRWSLIGTKTISFKYSNQKALLTQLVSPHGEPRIIIHWYLLSGDTFTSKIKVKLNETFNLLLGKIDNSAIVAFSVQYSYSSTQSELLLLEFIENNQVSMHSILASQ